MKVLLIGGTGAIGKSVSDNLGQRHQLVHAGRHHGDFRVDLAQSQSIKQLFEQVGHVDAIVSAAGNVHFGPLEQMSAQQFNIGLQDKLLGQVQLALVGQHYLADGGSITLTSGILAIEPIRNGASATTINAGLEGFVSAAAIELPRAIRINVVSPTVLTESEHIYGEFFPGFETVPASRVALAYQRSVEGAQTGRIYRVQ